MAFLRCYWSTSARLQQLLGVPIKNLDHFLWEFCNPTEEMVRFCDNSPRFRLDRPITELNSESRVAIAHCLGTVRDQDARSRGSRPFRGSQQSPRLWSSDSQPQSLVPPPGPYSGAMR
jgi:hypothetical protein